MNLTIAKRSWLVVAFLALSLLACAWMVFSLSTQAARQAEAARENTDGAVALADAQNALWELRYGFSQFVQADSAARATIAGNEALWRGKVNDAFTAYQTLRLEAEEREGVDKLKAVFAKYIEVRTVWLRLMDEGKTEEAKAWRAANTTPVGAQMVKGVVEQIALQKKAAESRHQAAASGLESARARTLSVIVAALLASAAAVLWLIRSILKPLRGMAGAVEDLRSGEGDLTRRLPAAQGELGDMATSINRFVGKLHDILQTVRRSALGVRQLTGEIESGVGALSSRTEEQASALEETAASMEEMTATVAQNAGNAKLASDLALNAAALATKGGAAVERVVATMGAISRSANSIGDITGVIDSIAFQTNILALNAAVEAARAGEQGRGFAVVAAEVRSLAQRSAVAAKEIKTLLGNSLATVDTGTKQVGEAGQMMREILIGIEQVTEITQEIAAASQEQAQGIEQVSETVTQLEKVTQQNAAMVEEASAAAASLEEQAAQLVEAVGAFKLDAGEQTLAGMRASDPASAPREHASAAAHLAAKPRPAAPGTALPQARVHASLAKLPARARSGTKPGGQGTGNKRGGKSEGWEEF